MGASNYNVRLIGAIIFASLFAPRNDFWLFDLLLYLATGIGLMMLTSPARQDRS